jgi:predicted lipoprotein with Yx(FWY)xxD motif
MRNSTIVGVLVVLLLILGGWYWWAQNGGPAMPGAGAPQACTMEAMVCPDGSSVGRTGPNCAFAPCPGGPASSAGINGSPYQGNMGGSGTAADDQGVGDASGPQQPMADGADGSIIGSNLALGTDSNAAVGTHLIGYNGMALYTYAPDKQSPGKSACTGGCAANWPPYIVGPEDNVAQVKAGVSGKVDTIIRADGKIQVTYNGNPLYFYIKDTPSATNGQGIGGVWFVVKP